MTDIVLVTAPAAYSARFCQSLKARHIRSVGLPLIETIPTPDTADMNALFAEDLANIDYVVFCSRCAIESFYAALSRRYGDVRCSPRVSAMLAGCAFATIGKDEERLIELLNVQPSVHPQEPSPAGIAAKLGEDAAVQGRAIAVLAPRVEVIEEPDVVPRFLSQLEELKMHVVRVDAYVTRPVSDAVVSQAVQQIVDRSVCGVAFTSGGEITALLRSSPACLNNMWVACFGPYTAGFAEKNGVKVSCVSRDFSSFDAFAATIEQQLLASA